MRTIKPGTLTVILGLALLLAASMQAQVVSGSVSGTVSDSQGAVVPGARVTLIDEVQATTRTMNTTGEGNFFFTPVLPSTYTVAIESNGFKRYEKKGIKVSPGDRIEVSDIRLDIGATTETVEVTASAVALETETAQQKSGIIGQQIVDMPIVDRNFMRVLQVVPGYAGGNEYAANVNGNRNDSMSVKLDGISNMDSGVNQCCSTWVNMDTIAEVTVVTNTASVQYGHSGGAAINVVTKGGTKDFHGSGYVFIRNESLNARGWNANSTPVNAATRKSTYRYNTDGFTLGGPVYIPKRWNTQKEKLFFFASEEHQNNKAGGGNRNLTVPTALERAGDFSKSIQNNGAVVPAVYDPLTGGQYYGGSPFPGNVVPSSRFNKDGVKFLGLLPLPNNIQSDHTYNYTYALTPTTKPELLGTYKFDYNINDRWRSFVRYTRDHYTADSPAGNGSLESLGTQRTVRNAMGAAVNVATTISATFTNEFHMGMSQNLIPVLPILDNPYTRSKVGLSYQPLYANGILADQGPNVTFGGNYVSNTPTLGASWAAPNFADNTNFNFTDNVAKVFNKHTVIAGVSIERDRKDQSTGNPSGSISFATSTNNPFDAGFTWANALMGNFNTYSQLDQQRTGKYRFTNTEWYVEDTWKATRKWTIVGGLRFAILQPLYDAKGQLGQFLPDQYSASKAVRLYSHKLNPANGKTEAWDPVTNMFANAALYGTVVPNSGDPYNGFVLAGTSNVPRGIVNGRGVQYGPGLGFAYSLDAKTVVRFGGRISYDRVQGNPWYSGLGIPPTTRSGTLYFGNINTIANGTVAFTAPGNNGAGISPDGHIPTVYSYNFSIQRELPKQIITQVAYVGNMNRHLYELVNINTPAWGAMWQPQNQDPSYTGANNLDGTHALPANFYRPMQGLDRMNYGTWGGTANYNSLQVTATRRAGKNMLLQTAYTFSKALGTADSIYNAGGIPGQIRQTNYGRLAYDRTHVLVVNYEYSFPKLVRGTNPVVNNFATRTVFNGWQVSGITTLRSGSPYGLNYSVLNQNLGTLLTGNPDYGPRATLIGDPTAVQGGKNLLTEFNLGAIGQTAKGSHGNDSGFNYLTTPWYWNTDMGIFKDVPFTKDGKRKLQFRIEFYNIMNHTNWGGVNSTVQYSAVGPAGTTGTILNLPQYLVGAGVQNGGRFGAGAAQSPSGGRIGEMSVKVYF
jgi:hypothetical protein